jgi:hypothetical protein
MTMSVGSSYLPTLARSADGGGTWTRNDLTASLGRGNVRLIAVDPHNARKVFLLWNDPTNGQTMAVTEDGGATAEIRWQPTGDGEVIKAFVVTASGAVLIATDLNGTAALHRSRDGGKTFDGMGNPPHIRGLSQRGPMLYAATDNFSDGYALATSRDDGTTWTALMSYDSIQAIAGCVKATCRSLCDAQVPVLWSADVCTADSPQPPSARSSASGCAVAGPSAGLFPPKLGKCLWRARWTWMIGWIAIGLAWPRGTIWRRARRARLESQVSR